MKLCELLTRRACAAVESVKVSRRLIVWRLSSMDYDRM